MYWYFEPLAQAPRGQARVKADQRRVMRVTARDDVYLQVHRRDCHSTAKQRAALPTQKCHAARVRSCVPSAQTSTWALRAHVIDASDLTCRECRRHVQRLVTDSARWTTPADDIIGYAPSQSTRDSPRKVGFKWRVQGICTMTTL